LRRDFTLSMSPRPPIEAGFRPRLETEFAPEVRNLGVLLGRNLDFWLAPGSLAISTPEASGFEGRAGVDS